MGHERKKVAAGKRKSSSRSAVWKYFTRDPISKKVQCKLCMEHYAYCNNTTNLHLHLKTKHVEAEENLPMILPSEGEEAAVEYFLDTGESSDLVNVEICGEVDGQADTDSDTTTAVYVVEVEGKNVTRTYPV